jgi:hypothetical protein
MIEKRRRAHKDAAQAIGFDLIGQLGQLGIDSKLFPASEMLLVHRMEFDYGLHCSKCIIVASPANRRRHRASHGSSP